MQPPDSKVSQSEDHGIAAVPPHAKTIYSVGISTGGIAEMRMAKEHPKVQIVASTIDSEGIEFATKLIATHHLTDRIQIKYEDAAKPLPYATGHFDYLYARLVLHYLTKHQMHGALRELYRVLRPGGSLFVAVRSTRCEAAHREGSTYDPKTGITTYPFVNRATGEKTWRRRYFQTEETITSHISEAGFQVDKVSSYDELLFDDFMRTIPGNKTQDVIEVISTKPSP